MIDILVPVLGRPQNAAPLVASIREATESHHRIVFICSPSDYDQIDACPENEEVLIVPWEPDRADYARKINYGFEMTGRFAVPSEWVFQGSDDLRFHFPWDTEAFVEATSRYSVVGTNDLRNRAVTKGLHSTHSLFRRDYIEKYGSGTPDNTGLVLTEVYDHQYVDNEFCETAMARGEFVFAKDSRVEHLHPLWGTAPDDETYRKAQRAVEADTQLYRERSARFYNQRRRRSRSR